MQIAGRQGVAAFDPEMIRTMQTALEAAWNALHCSGSELAESAKRLPTRTLLATRIVHGARAGERNYGPLLLKALEGLLSDATPHKAELRTQAATPAAVARSALVTPGPHPA